MRTGGATEPNGAAGDRPGGSSETVKERHVKLTVPADTRHLSKVRDAVLKTAGDGLFPPVKANMIALAVDEAVANIIEHAYAGAKNRERYGIHIELSANAVRFEVRIQDQGAGFDPRGAPEVDIKEHVDAGRTGGLGIFLMRRIMDEINYSFKQGVHNELQMIKYVDESCTKNKNKAGQTGRDKGR